MGDGNDSRNLPEGFIKSRNLHFLSQPNWTLTQVESAKVIGWPTNITLPHKLLSYLQGTQDADFQYTTLFQPN